MSAEPEITVVELAPDRRLARVGGATLPFRLDEPGFVIESEALGTWVGMVYPNHARELAKDLLRRKILNDSDIILQRQDKSGDRGRPATEVWLTRAGALKFAVHSRAPRATELLDLLVRVFLAVVDYGLEAGASVVRKLRAQLDAQGERIRALESIGDRGIVGPVVEDRLHKQLHLIAALRADYHHERTRHFRSALRKLLNKLGHTDEGCELRNLPRRQLATAERLLNTWERDAARYRRRHPYPGQLRLEGL